MILESITTTVDASNRVNIAPLGPIVLPADPTRQLPSFLLRPYEGSKTCENLLANGKAVIHVIDDVLLLAQTAIGKVDPDGLTCLAENATSQHYRLRECHRWFAVEVSEFGGTPPRHEMHAVCVAEATVLPFFGFNRAKHAVIEAAIMATRIGLIDNHEIESQMRLLRTPVEKTCGDAEREAFDLIEAYISERLQQSHAMSAKADS